MSSIILLTFSQQILQDFLWNVLCENANFVSSNLASNAKSKKISYLVSSEDVRRPFLTRAELCGHREWDFRFKVVFRSVDVVQCAL
jgi:hypothetical protein